MRLPKSAHTSMPWRIHEIAPDFRLEDVWALPMTGGAGAFRKLVAVGATYDPAQSSSFAIRSLFAIRWKLGGIFGWDDPEGGLGARVPTLRDRLPADLVSAPSGPTVDAAPFKPLYLLDNEWAAEIANRTVHGVLHLGWVHEDHGVYRAQMAVLVKPNGLFGSAYMAAIQPFRYLIVYPEMIREWGRVWAEQRDGPGATQV